MKSKIRHQCPDFVRFILLQCLNALLHLFVLFCFCLKLQLTAVFSLSGFIYLFIVA